DAAADRRRRRNEFIVSLRYSQGSELQPRIQEQRVVATGVAAEAVVVGRAAVEACIDRVLQPDLQVGEWPPPRVFLAKRDPVRLEDESVAVRLAVRAAGDRGWRVE